VSGPIPGKAVFFLWMWGAVSAAAKAFTVGNVPQSASRFSRPSSGSSVRSSSCFRRAVQLEYQWQSLHGAAYAGRVSVVPAAIPRASASAFS